MSSIGTLEANVVARVDQLDKDMKKAGRSLRGFASDAEVASNTAARALGESFRKIGQSGETAKRNVGQLATGVAMLSGDMAGASHAGQGMANALGGFLVGGAVGAGISILSTLVVGLGRSFTEAHEKAEAAARRHAAALKDLSEATAKVRDARKESDVRRAAVLSGGDEAAAVAALDRQRRENVSMDSVAKEGNELRRLKAQQAELDRQGPVYAMKMGIDPDVLKQQIRDQEQVLLITIQKSREELKALDSEVATETARGLMKIAQEAATAAEAVQDLRQKQAEATALGLNKADAARYVEDQARAAKAAAEQAESEYRARKESEAHVASLQQYIDAEERVLGMKAEELQYADLMARRDEAMALAQADQVNRLNEILATKRAISAATEAEKKAQDELVEAQRALAAAQADVRRAQGAPERAKEAQPAPGAAPAGSGAAPGDTGPGVRLTGGGPGVWFEQQAMGPLAAARQAKRDARQARTWQRHAANLAAEGRERMGATIDDFGPGGWGVDESGMSGRGSTNPRAQKPQMTFGASMATDEQAAANQRMNEALDRQRDAQIEANKRQEKAAEASARVAEEMKKAVESTARQTEAIESLRDGTAALTSAITTNGDLIAGLAQQAADTATKLEALNAQLSQSAQIAGP